MQRVQSPYAIAHRDTCFDPDRRGNTTPMLGDLITLPIRLTAQAATLALRTTERIANGMLGLAGRAMSPAGGGDGHESGPEPHPDARREPERDERERETGARPREHAAPASVATVEAGEPPADPEAHARAIVAREPAATDTETDATDAEPAAEPAHVSEEPELVEEFAEQGAEDGAGAEVRIDEPWDGYARMRAQDVIDRIATATAAELAAVNLYEGAHGARQTVLDAARRQLELTSRSDSTE